MGFNLSNATSAPASTTSSPLFSIATTTTTSSSTPAATSAPASSAAASTTTFPFGVGLSANNTTPASTGFGFSSSTSASGTTSSFTGFPQTSTPALSSQPQTSTTSAPLSFNHLCLCSSHIYMLLLSPRTSTTVAAPVAASPKLPSEITGKTVEEIIKEWNTELQERSGRFRKQANAIADWDKRILQNRDVLLRLEIEVAKVVETQSSLERQLELIETHQQEVDKALQSMEEEAERIYNDERKSLLDDEAASTRDAMYEQSELVERELEHMTEQIKSIIQSVNANQGGELEAIDGMSPLDVVVRILNNQLSSLMWIDEKAEEFSSRIQKIATQGSGADRELMAPKHWMS
ncbi:unnamed protein product [Arabis nemorensis]|uniref:Nucleoporin NSP1-like C-terminal domain-containing protein n=1 Tax=Arabis nemorensis TaxID=586526 RepID=A0A565BQ09_9BRAS|nr:unnamed protein product [Arabis nemorensis]